MVFLYIDPQLQHPLQPHIPLHLPSTRAYDHGRKQMTMNSSVTSWTLVLLIRAKLAGNG
jgi:hypothetical protein